MRIPDFKTISMKWVRISALRKCHLYPPRKSLLFISVGGGVDPWAKVRPEGLCQWKIPMKQSRIEPVTFRLVAQCSTNSATAYDALCNVLKLNSNETRHIPKLYHHAYFNRSQKLTLTLGLSIIILINSTYGFDGCYQSAPPTRHAGLITSSHCKWKPTWSQHPTFIFHCAYPNFLSVNTNERYNECATKDNVCSSTTQPL